MKPQGICPKQFIKRAPKAELHLHIEGTLQPELMLKLAQRNKVPITYKSVEQIRKAYNFENLQSFLDLYYQGANVLKTEQDFFELTWQYLQKIHKDNVKHVEIFFDPQTHTKREVPFEAVINGIYKAMQKSKNQLGISYLLFMCYLRHLSEQEAFETLKQAIKHKDKIYGVGLDSAELGNLPSKFQKVFAESIKEGFIPVAHAGQEGPPSYVSDALDILKARRIDHGIRCLENPDLVNRLRDQKITLTVCPLSNLKLCCVKDIKKHPLKQMLKQGLKVTVNSDDPSYFGGYINDNFYAVHQAFDLNIQQLAQLMINSFQGSFLNEQDKKKHIEQIRRISKQ